MPIILGIETATQTCSVAITANEQVLALKESSGSNEHSTLLTQYIQEVIELAGVETKSIDAIAVSIGPGSYTGLRIGLSAAKGLCYALDKPLIVVSTLKAIAHRALATAVQNQTAASEIIIIPLIDARRMEAYSASYTSTLEEISPVQALLIDENSFSEFKNSKKILVGDGAEKCKSLFEHIPDFYFPLVTPSAISICQLATQSYRLSEFADLAYSEPFYLKDFIAGKPRVKGLYNN